MSDVEKAQTSQTQFVQNYERPTNVAPRQTKIANPGALYVPTILAQSNAHVALVACFHSHQPRSFSLCIM